LECFTWNQSQQFCELHQDFVEFLFFISLFFWHENNYDLLASEQWVLLCDRGLRPSGLVGLLFQLCIYLEVGFHMHQNKSLATPFVSQ
jgi:hypothetical protein